jgi:hypothetical protein
VEAIARTMQQQPCSQVSAIRLQLLTHSERARTLTIFLSQRRGTCGQPDDPTGWVAHGFKKMATWSFYGFGHVSAGMRPAPMAILAR